MENKVFIITGSSGIAAETIKKILGSGGKVLSVDKNGDAVTQLSNELQKKGLIADFIIGDLTDITIAEKIVSECLFKYGRIDGLFNAAGISGRKFGDGPAHECTEEGWSVTLRTNLDTQYRMCREVLKVMIGQEKDKNGLRGTILNMASILGIYPEPKYFSTIAYATAKGAILSMTKSMAAYYAETGIKINALAPGLAVTKMSERASTNSEIVDFMKHQQPLTGKMMQPAEVADAAVFLLGSESKVITGQTLIVDAGWSIS